MSPQAKTGVEVERLPELTVTAVKAAVIGEHLDAILRASGSALRNYTMGSTRLKMHNAMRDFEAAVRESATAALAAERAEAVRMREAIKRFVDRDFTFFSGQMIGVSKVITQDDIRALRAALSPSQGNPK